jgi:hypothetical protein
VTYLVGREQAIAGHVTLYSEQFGQWPAHREISLLDRVGIYSRLLLSRVGLGEPPVLDDASGFHPERPFTEEARVIQEFLRPNSREDPVVVYELRD